MQPYSNADLFAVLQKMDLIDEAQLTSALKQADERHELLSSRLLKQNLIPHEVLGKIVGDLVTLPFIELDDVYIAPSVLNIIPKAVAQAQNIIAFKQDSTTLHVAMANPGNDEIVALLKNKTGLAVKRYIVFPEDIARALSHYVRSAATVFSEIIASSVEEAQNRENADPPIIRIVDTIIEYAYQNNASDIHVEPMEDKTLIRFRIDGMLHDIVDLPADLAPQIVTRVKVLADLRTDEHQESQDGKIAYPVRLASGESENLDIRVSIAVITRGEKIVMRLLTERSRAYSLFDLGLRNSDSEKLERAYTASHGMLLVTGPTGSGKTTTLYAVLKSLNSREVNIMTIEDPVEYDIENVNQIQVNPQAEITFAKGLRSIARQDPDVIMVGEIRDDETASIAINSAMTGHLVLSTLHTNDSVTSFPRLIDMGAEPYLVASTVHLIVSQRLVRKICTKCRVSQQLAISSLDEYIQDYFSDKKTITTYIGKGCSVCNQTGYRGRVGIFEVLEVSDEIKEAVTNKSTAKELEKLAIKQGMTTMLEDGLEKVKQGVTTIEEVLRVTKET